MNVPQDIRRLLHGLCDDQLSHEEHAELERWLLESQANRDHYREVIKLHGQLAWSLGKQSPIAAPIRPYATNRKAWAKWAWLSGGILVAATLLFLLLSSNGPQPSAEPPAPIARLVRSIACRWADEHSPVGPSDIRLGDRLCLAEGLAEVDFENGARLVLHGPVELFVESETRLYLREGMVTVTVAEELEGFTVYSDTAEVVDRGTQFGVQADPDGGLEVHVLEGRVDARPRGASAFNHLQAIQGLRLEAGNIEPPRNSPARFVPTLDASRQIVDWGGDYLQARKRRHWQPFAGPTQLVREAFADLDKNPSTVLNRGFDETVPLSPAFDSVPSGKSAKFYGGFEIWRCDAKDFAPRAAAGFAVGDLGAADSVRLYYGNSPNARIYGVWLFPESEFLVRSQQPWKFGRASGMSVRITVNHGSHFGVRFLVKSGDKFYLSQSATNEARFFTLSGWELANEFWTEYRPQTDLRAASGNSGTASAVSNLTHGAGSLRFEIPTSALDEIQAVGLYAESVDQLHWPNRHLEWNHFQVHAE